MQSLKKYVLFLLIAVSVASVGAATAQAQSSGMKADIPFDFSLGKTNLKAGSYWVKMQGGFVAIYEVGGKTNYSLTLNGGKSPERNGEPYLVFKRYGNEAFLNKIVFSGDQSYSLPRSNREKEAMAHVAQPERPTIVTGAAK